MVINFYVLFKEIDRQNGVLLPNSNHHPNRDRILNPNPNLLK